MEVRACKKCGTLFNFEKGLPLCAGCLKEIDDKFPLVKQYIYDHPGVGIQQVSEENEIPTAVIKKWVKEERLAFAEGSALGVECERCGRMILTGRFCEKCKSEVKTQFSSVIKKPEKKVEAPKEKEKDRMRFLRKE